MLLYCLGKDQNNPQKQMRKKQISHQYVYALHQNSLRSIYIVYVFKEFIFNKLV